MKLLLHKICDSKQLGVLALDIKLKSELFLVLKQRNPYNPYPKIRIFVQMNKSKS